MCVRACMCMYTQHIHIYPPTYLTIKEKGKHDSERQQTGYMGESEGRKGKEEMV